MIRCRYYGEDHALKFVVEGKASEEIYNTIVREGLVSTFQHAAYIGNELMKAGVDGLHFYTLNKAAAVSEILPAIGFKVT